MNKEMILNLLRQYGFGLNQKDPYLYDGELGLGIVYSFKDPFYGMLTRVYQAFSLKEYEDFLKERLDWYQYTMAQPCGMGADLIKAGLKPGPKFSEILAYSHDLHLSNVPKDEALAQTLAFARRLA